MKEKKLLNTRTCVFKGHLFNAKIRTEQLNCVFTIFNQRLLQCSVAKIRVVLDYFMGLIKCTNIRIVALDRLDSLVARTL